MKIAALTLITGLVALVPLHPATADSVEDDLAVVRNATAASTRPTAEAEPQATSQGPRWLRVRIVEKGEKKATVKVNLPLFLVHAVGDDLPIPGCEGRGGKGSSLTLGEVLRALDSGESLVEIDDDDATVRVWVE